TPASTARMTRAAPVAAPEKILSPARRVAVRAASASRVSNSAALMDGSAPRSDRVDGGLDLLPQRVADRGRAGVLGRGLLALGADDVALERLDELALV